MSEGKQGEGGRLLSPRKSSEKAPDSEVVTYSRKRKAGADEAADAKPVKKEADDEPRKPEDDWPVSAYGSGREAARLAMQRVRQQASSKKGKKPAGKQPAGGAADLQARFSGAATDSGGEDGVPAKEEPEGDSSVLPKVGAEERVGKGAPAVGEEPEGGRRTRASMAAGALQTKGKVGKGQKKAEQEKTQPPGKDGKAGEQSSPGGGTIGRSLSPRLALKRCEDAKSPKASGGMTPRLAARRGEVEDGAAPAEGGKQAKVEEESRQSAEESGALAGGAVVKNGKSAIESKGRPESADEKRETRQRGRPKLDTGEVVFEREIATPRQSARGKPAEGLRISPRGKKESKAVAVQTAAVVEIEKKKPKKEEEKEETIVLDTEIPAEAVGASESGKEKQEGGVDVTQGAEVLRKVVEAEGNGTEGGEKKKDEGAGKEGKDGKEVEAALALLEAIGKELGPEQEESSELGTSQKDAAGGPDEGKADAAVGPNIEKVDEETGPKAEAPMATTAEEAGSAAVRTEELVTEIPSVSESAAVQESPAPEEEGKGAGDLPPPVRLTRQQLRERKEVGGTGGAKPKEPSTEVGIAEEKIPEGEGLETQAEPKERGEGAEAVLELGSGLVGVVKAEEVSGSEATPAEKDGQGAETESPVDAAKEKVEDEEKEKVPVPVVKAAPLNPATCPICLKTFKSPKAMYGHQRTHDTGQRSRVENPKVGVKRKESAAGAPVAKAPKKAASEGAGEKAVGKGDAASKLEVKKEAGAVAKKLGETPPTRVLKKRRVTEVAVEKKQHESVEGQTVKKLQGFTGAPKPGEAKPGEAKPGVKPGVKLGVKPGLKPGVAKPGDGKLGEGKPGGKPGVKPGVKLVKKLPVPEAKGSAGGEATCPICQRTFHSNKAMYGHQRAHNSAKGVSAAPKITPAKSPETKKLKKVSLGKVPEGAPLLKKKSTLGKASASGQLKKLAAVLQKLKKGPVGKGLVKSSGVPAKLKPKQESLAGAETPASPATCPICLRTFQSPKAMYGHQRTHDLDERSRLSGVGLPPVKVKEGLPVRKLKPPGLLGKKKKLSAVAVAPGVLIRKKPPGGPSGPSVVLAWNKKAAAQSVLLAQKKKRSEPAPTFKPTVVHTESQEEGAEEEGDGRASLDGAESPAHTPGSVPTCPVCQRTFKSRKALYGHQRTHGGGFAVAVQKKLRLGRPPSASGMMKKKSLGSEGSEGEQSRFDRLRSRVRGEGSLADVSEEGERRSGRLPVFEALGGSDNQGVVAGPRTIPHSELRGGRMQGAVCHQGRTPLPRVRTVITPDDVLADSGGYSIKGVMQNPTAGSLVGSCLECRGGVFSEGRAWLRCGGGCGRYIHQKCTARPRMKGPPGEGYIYACWECRECHSCGVRLLDAPEPGQHKERQYTLCPPCARLWAMHNYCTACEKVYHDDYVGEPMVQCTICFHWCHAACEGYSKDQYATLVEDPNSVFHCSRCQSGARKPAPRPISEAEAIAEAAAEKAAQMGGTNRLGRRTPGARASASIFDAPVRKTGSMQQLLTEAGLETLERIPTPKSKVRPKSAPKTPRANADDLAVANRALGAGLLRPGLVTNSPKRARSNAAIRASKKARVRTAFQGWGKSLQGAPPLSPTTGLIAPEDRDTSRTGRRLKTPARLVETEHLEGGENDQEGFDNGVAVASTPSWKKKLAASVVAAKLGQLGKVAGKRKRAEAEAADEVIEEEALIGSLVRRLNSPLPRPADTPSKQVAFAVDATQKADASPQRDPPKVVAKQRIRHVAGEGPWCGDRRHPPQAVVRFSSGALCALEACKVCGGLGDRDEDEYLCCVDCGEAYHSFCLEPPLRRNEKSRAFWRCPTCKLCDACGHNEDRASMILCSHCDASYHEGCLDERSTPNEKQRKLGWICPGCSSCACGTRLGLKASSMRWFPRSDGSVVCTKCLRQKSRGHLCSVCRTPFEDAAAKDINECATCFLKVHRGCDQSHRMPKPGAAYHCPSCRKSGTPKDASGVQLRSAKKRLKGAPGTPSARPSQAIGGSPFRGKVQPPTLIVENPAAEEAAGALQMDPSMGVGELGLTPGTMARLGLDSGFGTASFAEEQQELEADSELAMLLRTGSDVDLASIGGGLLGSLQSPEGLAFLRTGASDGGASAKAVEPQPAGAGESTEQEGGPARPGTAKMAAFKVPPLIVNSFVSPGASSGSPFGMLFSQRSDQVALPNFLPGQLDTPNVAGSGLWSSPPVDAPPGSQLDATPGAAEEAGKNGLGGAETPRGGALSAEEKQRVRERLSQLDTPTQVRLQRFLEAEKAKQDAQWAQVENFMQKHSRLQAERENAALRPPALSPPFRGGPSPGPLQGLLGSPSQHAFLPLTAEQTYLRPDALDHHPLLSPPDRPDPQSQETALPPRSGSAPEPAGYWEGRPFYREPAPHRLPFPGGSASRPMGPPFPGIGPPGPPSPEEMHGRQIELAKRMATNANAAETFLKKLPPQLAKELQDRFPEGVPPSVLSAIAQHLVRVSTQQQQQASPHARPSPPQGPLGASPLSPAGVPYVADKNALAALQMPPPTSVVRSPRMGGAQQMNVSGGGNGLLRGQALRSSPTFLAQYKRGEKGQARAQAPWNGGYGGQMDPSSALARMAAAKRTMNQMPSPPTLDRPLSQGGGSGLSVPGPGSAERGQMAPPSARPSPPPSEPLTPIQLTPQQMVRKAELEQWVTQKYNELVENPDSVRRLVHMHNSGTLPPDAGPHIAVLKKLLSDQQKASGIQAKYTALILACQKEALAHGDRKRAQLAIRGLQQKQEEERRRASAEQQKYIRQEAAKMATEVVEKEARAARGTQNKDSFPGVFSASLFQGGGDPSGDFLGAGLPSPGQLPSPESFFASGAFGSVEKLPGGHSALRGEAARTESPDMFGNGGMPKSVQMYPRSVSPVPLVPVQQSSASGGLQWDSRFNDNQLEPFPIGTDRTEPAPAGDRQHFSEASQEGRLQGREDDRSGLQGDRSVKRRKEELRAVGGSGEEGLKVKRLSELRDISREGSPVIAQLGRKPLRPAGSLPPMGKSAPGASADQDSAARESHVAASQPENVPVKRPKSMDSSGSDSEDEPLILTASKRALGVGSEPRLVRDPSTEKKGGLAGEKAKRSLGGMLSESLVGEEEVRVSDEAAGVGATEATTSKLEKKGPDSSALKDPAAEDGKKAKRRKGIGASGELLLLAQTARQQLTQLLKAERDSQDRTMSALFESVGEKRIAELERQAREKLIGPGDSVFVAGQEPVGLGKEMADLVVGGFVVDGGVLAVSLQPPGTEVEFHNVSLVKEEAGEGPGKVERGESSGQIRGAKGSKKRKAMEGGEDGDGPRAKKQRSSHLQIRQAVRAQMPVKPNKEVSRGVEVAGGAPGGTEPMWSEKWWLEKWKKEEKAAKAARAQGEDGASSGEDVPIGRALMNKGVAEKRLGSKKKRLSHKRPVTHASEPAFKSDLRPCTLCRKGAHEGGAGRLLYCGPATWVHINCIMWAQHIPRLPSGELWFVHSVLLRAWKRRCSGCGDFGASVACSSIHCAERFHFPCALKAGAAFVQGGRVYCAKHSTKERLKRLTTVQGDTHFARLRAFVEPWWTRERLPRGSREGLEQSEKAGQEPGQKDDQAAEASEEAGQPVTNLEPGQAAGQAVEPAQQTAEARAGAPRDLPAGGSEAVTAGTGGEPAVRNGSDAGRSIPEADGPGPDPDGREIKRARLDGPELESEPVLTTQAAGERELEPTDGIAGQSVPATNVVSGESDGRQPLESGDAAGGSELPAGDVEASLSEGPVHTGFGLDPMQIDIKTEGNVGVPMQEERGERPLSAAPSDSAGPSGGNNMHDNGPPVESTNTTRFLQVSLPRADSLRFESSSPRRSPGSFASPIAGLSIVKGKRAKRSRLEDSWGSGQLLPGGPTPARNHPPWEEDDSETPPGEGPRLVQFLRVGALSVESLGELVHDQRGFHSLTQLYPVGFRAWRVHWSTQRPNQRCLYLLEIVRTAYGPLFRIMAWGEVGRRREPEGAAPVNPPMHPITASSLDEAWANLDDRIWAMRRSNGVAWKRHRRFWGATHSRGLSPLSPRAAHMSPKPLSPHFQHQDQGPAACGACCGAWLFGLHVWDVCKRMEFLPRAEECPRYKFRHREELVGRNLKLAECARTAEPWIRHLVERTEDDMAARVAAVKAAQRRTTTAFQQVVMDDPAKGTSTSHKADAIVHMPAAMQYRSMRENLKARVRVGASEIHGKGLFAKTMIMHREMVIEYVGELIRPKISDMREKAYRAQKMGCYFFGFPPSKQDHLEDLVVDATRRGNAARNINHSCGHNCVTKAVVINGVRHLIVFAIRTIMPGEEITINYCFRSDPTEEKVPCLCGSVKCKGFLN